MSLSLLQIWGVVQHSASHCRWCDDGIYKTGLVVPVARWLQLCDLAGSVEPWIYWSPCVLTTLSRLILIFPAFSQCQVSCNWVIIKLFGHIMTIIRLMFSCWTHVQGVFPQLSSLAWHIIGFLARSMLHPWRCYWLWYCRFSCSISSQLCRCTYSQVHILLHKKNC